MKRRGCAQDRAGSQGLPGLHVVIVPLWLGMNGFEDGYIKEVRQCAISSCASCSCRVSTALENWSVSAVKSEHSTIGE